MGLSGDLVFARGYAKDLFAEVGIGVVSLLPTPPKPCLFASELAVGAIKVDTVRFLTEESVLLPLATLGIWAETLRDPNDVAGFDPCVEGARLFLVPIDDTPGLSLAEAREAAVLDWPLGTWLWREATLSDVA